MTVNYPVFILAKDSGEISRFDSVEEMQRQLEKIDVENGEYVAWDRNGTSLNMSVQKPVWLRIEPAVAKLQQIPLRDALTQYGKTLGVDVEIDGTTDADFEKAFAKIRAYVDRKSASRSFKWLARISGIQPREKQ
jgi:hypothetical protein